MARSYSNLWSRAAARLTMIAHTPAPGFRWAVFLGLVLIWFGMGLWFWLADHGWLEALYRTLAAVSMYDAYFNAETSDYERNAVRFAALAVPVVGLLFAFSGALGRNLAQSFNRGAARHVVIAGENAPAISLALDCRKKRDAVMLIGESFSDDTARTLRGQGVIVIEGDATRPETLKNARAHHAAHVVAFKPDDTSNLHIEAAVRRLVGKGKRKPPIGVHVATRSSMLLREAREMRAQQTRRQANDVSPVDPKPFSLDEIAARLLIQRHAQDMLDSAQQLQLPRIHVVFFGFDEAAEALASALFKSLWSARFEAPRVTVLTPEPHISEARFKARHREAFAYTSLWAADIAFLAFDWDAASLHGDVLTLVENERGKPCAAVVSTGADPGNIHLAIALKRACNHGARWPIPIFMKETSQSEFSQEYARGDDTVELDAYLQAFGGHQDTATRRQLLDGAIDRGAAIAHEHYSQNLGQRDAMSMRELQAAMKDWSQVLETYRAANRAVADSALIKLWDMGFRPAKKTEKGDTALPASGDQLEAMAQREHDRWVAERLMSGWRPTGEGEARNNDLMAHDKLVGWDRLNDDDRARDRVQVRAAMDIARLLHPNGFVARGA